MESEEVNSRWLEQRTAMKNLGRLVRTVRVQRGISEGQTLRRLRVTLMFIRVLEAGGLSYNALSQARFIRLALLLGYSVARLQQESGITFGELPKVFRRRKK